ncbi:hypothetical protein EOL99_03465 [Candidatus Falkowbacteria bacterium]|nr:hypothetical protein [Candidatus Falkowbacteria bacterium]
MYYQQNLRNQLSKNIQALTNATSQRFFDIQSQLAQCCCDNKLAVADLKFQACENTNRIIENSNSNAHSIEMLINSQEVERLRERLNNCDTQLAISNQTATILGQLGTFYPNPPCGCSCSC